MQIVKCQRFKQSLTHSTYTSYPVDALIRQCEGNFMSMCMCCNATLSQAFTDASFHVQPGIRFEALNQCSSCDAEARLMLLSEAAQAAACRAQEQAKLSARWILAILVFTCGISLLSLLPNNSKDGTSLTFSSLSLDLRAKGAKLSAELSAE